MIILAKKGRNNKELLIIKNIVEILIVKVVKMLNIINFYAKHGWFISNGDINIAKILELTSIKNY